VAEREGWTEYSNRLPKIGLRMCLRVETFNKTAHGMTTRTLPTRLRPYPKVSFQGGALVTRIRTIVYTFVHRTDGGPDCALDVVSWMATLWYAALLAFKLSARRSGPGNTVRPLA